MSLLYCTRYNNNITFLKYQKSLHLVHGICLTDEHFQAPLSGLIPSTSPRFIHLHETLFYLYIRLFALQFFKIKLIPGHEYKGSTSSDQKKCHRYHSTTGKVPHEKNNQMAVSAPIRNGYTRTKIKKLCYN